MDILDRILEAKRADVEAEIRQIPMRRAIEMASAAPPPRPFVAALRRGDGIRVIAEVKRASPSKGEIRPSAEPAQVARAYAEAGAAAVSVLTDARFFLGAPSHLQAVRAAVAVPVMRKDFIFDEYQVYRTRALGADALLLIARILEAKVLRTLLGVTRSLEMEALVEVHDEEDVRKAIDCGASALGVNNRDLGSLEVSLDTSLRLAPLLPQEAVKVSESGIETRADIDRLLSAGYHAFLVGGSLMRQGDPGAALRRLLRGEAA